MSTQKTIIQKKIIKNLKKLDKTSSTSNEINIFTYFTVNMFKSLYIK